METFSERAIRIGTPGEKPLRDCNHNTLLAEDLFRRYWYRVTNIVPYAVSDWELKTGCCSNSLNFACMSKILFPLGIKYIWTYRYYMIFPARSLLECEWEPILKAHGCPSLELWYMRLQNLRHYQEFYQFAQITNAIPFTRSQKPYSIHTVHTQHAIQGDFLPGYASNTDAQLNIPCSLDILRSRVSAITSRLRPPGKYGYCMQPFPDNQTPHGKPSTTRAGISSHLTQCSRRLRN